MFGYGYLDVINLLFLGGEPNSLPIQVYKIFKTENDGTLDVDVVVCTTAQILDEFGKNTGGENYKTIKSTLKKLGACRLELTTNKHDRYLGSIEHYHFNFNYSISNGKLTIWRAFSIFSSHH